MKVLIADKLPDDNIDAIKKLGCEVNYNQQLKDDKLLKELKNELPEILIVRSTIVTKEMIEGTPSLSLIIRAGSGYNTIDVNTASQKSVYVANCPGKNSIAVAELAFGLILSLDRRIPDNVLQIRNGRWNKKEFSKSRGVFGRTLGIVGLGRIGKQMIPMARSFGMGLVGWSRSLNIEKAERLNIDWAQNPEEVASRSDIVSIHLALTDDTKGMIGKSFFRAMKPGSYFINTSRAEIVDHDAMLKAMDEKHIRCGLDVIPDEPEFKEGEYKNDLLNHKNFYITHHIGASTSQAQSAVAEEAVRIVNEYINTGRVLNCVNLIERTTAPYIVFVHHRNKVGVLANVLDVIRACNINIEIMENNIFNGESGACGSIQIDGKLTSNQLSMIENSSKDIFSVQQVKIE